MIRTIQARDWPGIDFIQRNSFPPSAIETVESLRSVEAVAPEMCVVAEDETGLIGYLLAHPWMPEDMPRLNEILTGYAKEASCVFIHDLALLPRARGSGLAKEMVEGLFTTSRAMGMTSAALLSVQGTVEFWKRFGFMDRPELTARFRKHVVEFYEIDFHFMTASLI